MPRRLKIGDHVTWNSEAGHVSGEIIKVHTEDCDYKAYTATPAKMNRNMRSKMPSRWERRW